MWWCVYRRLRSLEGWGSGRCWSVACVGEEDAEGIVRVAGQAGQAESVGDEAEGVVGGAMWPVRQSGEYAGEGNGFGIGHQVAGQQGWEALPVVVRWGLVAQSRVRRVCQRWVMCCWW